MKRHLGLAVALLAALPAPASAATWSSPSSVPGSRNAAVSRPAIARDGTLAVGWGEGKVALRRPGRDWQRRTVASPNTSAIDTDVAFDSEGRLVVVWTQSPSRPGTPLKGPFTIRAVTWTAKSGWGTVRVLGRSGHFTLADPRIAVNDRGDAIVFWRGFRRSGSRVVEAVASSFRAAGERFGSEQHVTDGGPYRDVALDDRGNAYAVFTAYSGPRNRFSFKPRGRAWGAPRALPGRPASLPVIVVAPDRSAVIAWRTADVDSEGNGLQTGPVQALVRSPAGAFGPSIALSEVPVHDIAGAAVSPQGEILLAWSRPEFTEPAIPETAGLRYALRPPGGDLSAEQTIPSAQAGPAGYLGDGTALIAYADGNAIRALVRPRGGAFGTPETVTSRGSNPALATAGSRAVVSYYDPVVRLARVVRRAA